MTVARPISSAQDFVFDKGAAGDAELTVLGGLDDQRGVVGCGLFNPRREGEEDMTKYSSGVVVDTRRLHARVRGFSGDGLTLETPPGDFGFAVASVARLAGVGRWPGGQRWPVFSGGELKELARAGRMVSPSKHRPDTSILPSLVGLNDERGVYPAAAKICSTPRPEVAETSDFSDISHAEVVATYAMLSVPVSGSVVGRWSGWQSRGLRDRSIGRALASLVHPNNRGAGPAW